jgi:hypothetical protein
MELVSKLKVLLSVTYGDVVWEELPMVITNELSIRYCDTLHDHAAIRVQMTIEIIKGLNHDKSTTAHFPEQLISIITQTKCVWAT